MLLLKKTPLKTNQLTGELSRAMTSESNEDREKCISISLYILYDPKLKTAARLQLKVV